VRLDHLLSKEEVEEMCFTVEWSRERRKAAQRRSLMLTKCSMFLVAMRLWETPVPIPNTMVKPQAADGTALETVWESRWLPESKGLIAQLVRAHAW
jgi:hypothetical protein